MESDAAMATMKKWPVGEKGDPGQGSIKDYEKKSIPDVYGELASSEKGLSTAEAKARKERFGPNEIIEKKVNPFKKFLGYFWGPIPIMIMVAVVLSAIIGHWEDFFIILALLITNAIVGFYQESRAGNAIELLKQRLAPEARVLRDGRWVQIPAKDLVPGDIVLVRLGDIVPADVKLVEGKYLEVDQSALTGESLPVEKAVNDVCYSGSIVQKGEMSAVVVVTGAHTYFGKTTELVEEAKATSHFQRNVVKIGDYLIAIDAVLVAVVFIAAISRHESILDTLQFALVLTISAIPVALPAVLSVTLAIGAMALAKREAIVSKLVAIEEMAGTDILCCDKTGTITQNKLTLANVIGYEGVDEAEVVLNAALASRAEDKDPIDNAVLLYAGSMEGTKEALDGHVVKEFTPFDPVIKRTEALIEGKDGQFQVAKGAPQVIMGMTENKEQISAQLKEDVQGMAARGYRSLGVARRGTNGWRLIGLIGLHDPPRPDSAETIRKAKQMGLDIKMVTGDHVDIAQEIAREVGLRTDIVPASSLMDVPDKEASEVVEKVGGFAEVFPEHKYRIVQLLQGEGHIVGMTGDGVNDAPALKKADAGIAVEGATDAAKSAADIVLTLPGLGVVVDAVIESRRVFQRMINYSIYRISETIRLLFFITLSILIFQFYPITALMIVLLALLNDLPILTIAFDNVRYSARPEKWDMRVLLVVATFLGAIGVVMSFMILYIGLNVFHLSHTEIQSFVYLKLSVGGHLVLLVARTKGPFWSVRPAPQLLWAIILTQTTATLLVLFGILLPPLAPQYVAFVWIAMLLVFVFTDLLKVRLYSYLMRRGVVTRGIGAPEEIDGKGPTASH